MKETCKSETCENFNSKKRYHNGGHGNTATGGGLYFMGMIGAAIYFISQAPDFWMGVLGFLKAMIWPAIMVYEAFKVLLG